MAYKRSSQNVSEKKVKYVWIPKNTSDLCYLSNDELFDLRDDEVLSVHYKFIDPKSEKEKCLCDYTEDEKKDIRDINVELYVRLMRNNDTDCEICLAKAREQDEMDARRCGKRPGYSSISESDTDED